MVVVVLPRGNKSVSLWYHRIPSLVANPRETFLKATAGDSDKRTLSHCWHPLTTNSTS